MKKIIILWVAFVVCLVATIGLWFAMNSSNPEFEEVKATVVSAETTKVVNRKTGSSTTFYDVKVEYEGKTYDLGNAHSVYEYPKGKVVKAYLSNGKLYANEEGVKTATPIATVYYIFLFGTFGMLIFAPIQTSKICQKNKEQKEAKVVEEGKKE